MSPLTIYPQHLPIFDDLYIERETNEKVESKMKLFFLQAITRVRDLVKELETKESANKETVQILKQEFVEHKTTYEKVEKEMKMF